MFKLHGRQQSEFCGAYEAWSDAMHPDDRVMSERALEDALAGKHSFDCELLAIGNLSESIRE